MWAHFSYISLLLINSCWFLEYFDYWSCCCHAAKDIYIHLTETLHYSNSFKSILRVYFGARWLKYFYFYPRKVVSRIKYTRIMSFQFFQHFIHIQIDRKINNFLLVRQFWRIFIMKNWKMKLHTLLIFIRKVLFRNEFCHNGKIIVYQLNKLKNIRNVKIMAFEIIFSS